MEATKPTIPEWFRGRDVLVTGGTGFMGKVLLAKLLMSCPDIGTVYALIRAKKNQKPEIRLNALRLYEEPFRKLREENPHRMMKNLVAVSGDTTVEGIGLSEADAENLKNKVSVIINMAANVKFDLPLKTAVNLNTRGTANVLAFAKQVKNLESFVHVSTAYCHCGEPVLEEKWYPVAIPPEEVMEIVNKASEEDLVTLTPKILGDQPNTYAFTKALSEDLVKRSGLPAGIARPSIVVGSFKEPECGWVDNMNGPTGLMVGAGKGVIRSMLCNSDYHIDVIPCDMAVNATIALAWKVGLNGKPNETSFINLTESGENPITWGYALETGKKHALENPFSGPLWYPGGGLTSSRVIHWLSVIFLHLLPAYFLDGLMMLTGNKPFLVKIQGRVNYGLSLVHYYTTKKWDFRNDGLRSLRDGLSPSDKETFFMDIKDIEWNDYLMNYMLGARKYVLKDDPSTLPRARKIFKILYVVDRIFRVSFLMLFGWFVYSWIILPYKTTVSKAM